VTAVKTKSAWGEHDSGYEGAQENQTRYSLGITGHLWEQKFVQLGRGGTNMPRKGPKGT